MTTCAGSEFLLNQITQFGPYKLIERISVGGMAEVYKATEHGVEGFERTVAVKRILPHIAEDDEFITMFKDEAKIAGQLQHGNIAQIYNLGQQGDSFYIALEYVAGRDLRNIFTRCQQQGRPMPLAQACFIVMKVGEGLDYAHNKRDKHGRHLNIVHRDVSPPNVLVSYEGEVKLIDFGVAKAAGRVSRTQAGILKGKFGYMSPEQVRGMPLDRRSDVFSLGVVLYETIVGQRLFQGDTDFATLEMVRTVDVPLPSTKNPEIPKELEAIMMKALSGEPETRYQTAMELHDDLQAFMFQQGMFYSRKDLAAWMRKQYAREMELDKDKNAGKPPPRPAPPGGAAGRKPAPPASAPPRPAAAGTPAARPIKPPPGKPAGRPGDAAEPTEEQLAAARKRSKTMLMSPSNRPTTLRPGSPTGAVPVVAAAPRPAPVDPLKAAPPRVAAAPRPMPTKQESDGGGGDGGDLEWDDDELETKLFDEQPPGTPAVASAAPGVNRSKVKPEEIVQPQTPKAGQIEIDEDDGPATVQIPPNAAAVILGPLMGQGPAAAESQQGLGLPPPPGYTPPMGMPASAHSMAEEVESLQEETEASKPKPPLKLIAGIAAGVLLLVLVWALIPSGDKPAETTTDEVASNDPTPTTPDAAIGGLQLDVTPGDAKVEVDGQEIAGSGSPRMVSNLSVGTHKLRVSFGDDYLPFEQDVNVAAGQPLSIPVKLRVREVTVSVTTEPAEAKVLLVEDQGEPKLVGKGGDSFKVQRKPGAQYRLIAELAGYESAENPLTFSGGPNDSAKLVLVKSKTAAPDPTPTVTKDPPKPKDTTKTPTKPKAKTAELKIGSAPGLPPATVWIDGAKQAKTTPVIVMVTAGSHTIKWQYPDKKTATKKITVGENSSTVVKP